MVEEAKALPRRKAEAVQETASALKERNISRALNASQKDLMPGRYDKAIENLKRLYPKEAASPFVQGLDPLAGEVARGAIQDRLDPDVSAEEMTRRRRLASLGGAIGGGVLVPGVVAAGLGGGLGALRGKGPGRISGAVRGAGHALTDTFHRASVPALAAGAGIGAMGARSQYDLGAGLAELASAKTAGYGAFALTGAGIMGGTSLLSDKDKILRDARLRRSGKISRGEIKNRLKQYGQAAAINAGVGGALGAGGLYAFRRVVKPELARIGNETAAYAAQKVEQASAGALKNIDDLATKHRKASAEEARNLADRQVRRLSETDLLAGTKTGLRDLNPFRRKSRREQRWADIADGVA